MSFSPSHPPWPLRHPWDEPLSPRPIGVDRPPDWTLPFAPDPHDFPFDEQGQRDYYVATVSAARQREIELRMRHEAEIGQAGRENSARESARRQFLLLLS